MACGYTCRCVSNGRGYTCVVIKRREEMGRKICGFKNRCLHTCSYLLALLLLVT